ncbi:hypothetical protein AJ80_04828 [Polytolypa hystricis UAMH7299]|uniref:DNA-binding protein RAP1 n=1 Tax=Polytolypa hystricis (strain UAMH7299) TaxID=1447883 RepID=A0A2B7Y8M0_POLH7|nr:hypothetical protein AJ80_04828 [Polytolypa hystricis UAMH7299]
MAAITAGSEGLSSSTKPEPLFHNLKFWLTAKLPSRKTFRERIEANGGKIVHLEKDADILLVDHAKKGNPAGTYSYKFVEDSIRSGSRANLEDYRQGPPPGTIRTPGSKLIPVKGRRTPFSAEDDRILYEWVKPIEDQGGPFQGNQIYKQLEAKHPNHTYQSWRDRYIKVVRYHQKPVASGQTQDGPTSSAAPGATTAREARPSRPTQNKYSQFTQRDKIKLLEAAEDVLNVDDGLKDEAWSTFAKNTDHSAKEWESYFKDVILPLHKARRGRKARPTAEDTASTSTEGSSYQSQPANTSPQATLPSTSRRMENVRPAPETQARTPGQGPTMPTHHATRDVPSSRKRSIREEPSRISSTGLDSTSSSRSKRRKLGSSLPPEIPSTPEPPSFEETIRRPSLQPSPPRSVTDTAHKKSKTTVHSRSASREIHEPRSQGPAKPASPSTSENSQFETAPQFPAPTNLRNASPTPIPEELELTSFLSAISAKPRKPVKAPEEPETTITPSQAEAAQAHDIDEWIASRLQSGKATDEMQILTALSCTSMDPDLADTVLEYLVAGKGIPEDMRGVWTEEDDKVAESVDGRAIGHLIEKHGRESIEARFEYLALSRQADADEES